MGIGASEARLAKRIAKSSPFRGGSIPIPRCLLEFTHGMFKQDQRARADAVLATPPDRVEAMPDFGRYAE